MASTLEGCLQNICENVLLSKEDRMSFGKDAEIIRNHVINLMKKADKEFAEAYDGLSLTGSYLDNLKIDHPDEFDLNIKLKMPFSMKPTNDINRPGFVRLQVKKGTVHQIVRKNRVSRYWLQQWIRNVMLQAIHGTGCTVDSGLRRYSIEYSKYARGYGVAHTILARDVAHDGREISFDFVPTFEFSPEEWPLDVPLGEGDWPWFAVPFGKPIPNHHRSNKFAFKVAAPHWEREALKNKMNLKNSLRLMKAFRDACDMTGLSSYMLKSVYLGEIYKRPIEFWEQSIGTILIEMLQALQKNLMRGRVAFFFHGGFNHLDMLKKKLIGKYQAQVGLLLTELIKFKDNPNMDPTVIERFFTK